MPFHPELSIMLSYSSIDLNICWSQGLVIFFLGNWWNVYNICECYIFSYIIEENMNLEKHFIFLALILYLILPSMRNCRISF